MYPEHLGLRSECAPYLFRSTKTGAFRRGKMTRNSHSMARQFNAAMGSTGHAVRPESQSLWGYMPPGSADGHAYHPVCSYQTDKRHRISKCSHRAWEPENTHTTIRPGYFRIHRKNTVVIRFDFSDVQCCPDCLWFVRKQGKTWGLYV